MLENKVYLSIENGDDVGIYTAIRSCGEKHSNKEENLLTKFVDKLLKRLTKIVPQNYNL